MSLLSQLSANKFSQSEKDVYKILALIEKEIGWDLLIKLRDEIFVKGEGNDWDNPKVAAECQKPDRKSERPKEQSLDAIHKVGQSICSELRSRKPRRHQQR
jgi:hypothetical protein